MQNSKHPQFPQLRQSIQANFIWRNALDSGLEIMGILTVKEYVIVLSITKGWAEIVTSTGVNGFIALEHLTDVSR